MSERLHQCPMCAASHEDDTKYCPDCEAKVDAAMCDDSEKERQNQIAALQLRLEDIAAPLGVAVGTTDDGPSVQAAYDSWGYEVRNGMKERLGITDIQFDKLSKFKTWQAAAEWLHGQGVRA